MLSLIFLLVFPFAVWNAWKNVQLAKASTTWPATAGTVTASERKRVTLRTQPRVVYSYAVNGTSYTSERISFAAGVPPKETDEFLARYPVGKNVSVHYSPEKPSDAVLEPGTNKHVTAQLRLLLVCFVIIIAVNVLLVFLRAMDKRENPARTGSDDPLPGSILAS